MKITLLTVGTRGDVQPLLGFGLGLEAAGHDVRLAAVPEFESQVKAAGLDYAPLAEGQVSAGRDEAESRRWLERGPGRLPAWMGFVKDARSVASERLANAISACRGADVIVTNELALLLGWQAAEHFGVPLVRGRLCPPPRMAQRPAARFVRQAAWLVMRRWLASARRDAGLPLLPRREPLGQLVDRRTLELRAYSPVVVPETVQAGPWTHVTGFWFFDSQFDPEPPQGLEEFLAAGPAPVCVGFGSMVDADPAGVTGLVVEALQKAGQRGVLICGEFGFGAGELPADMFAVEKVEHDWLFERCSAVVHHGGAGTTAAALRAGVPSVVVPHMMDQYAWGRAVHELGAGPRPIPRRKLSMEGLREAVKAASTNTGMRERAAEVGGRIREEHGIANAVEAFERHMDLAAEPVALEVTNG